MKNSQQFNDINALKFQLHTIPKIPLILKNSSVKNSYSIPENKKFNFSPSTLSVFSCIATWQSAYINPNPNLGKGKFINSVVIIYTFGFGALFSVWCYLPQWAAAIALPSQCAGLRLTFPLSFLNLLLHLIKLKYILNFY